MVLIDPGGLAVSYDPEPRFANSREGTVHMEDTNPLQIGTAGTPNVIAGSVRSLWQTDSVGLRMLIDMAWTMRAETIALVEDITW